MRFLSLTASLLIIPLAPAFALDRYDIKVEPDASAVEVRACFDGKPPRRLYRHSEASGYTEWLQLDGQPVNQTSSRIYLGELKNGGCAQWRVNLQAAAVAGDYRVALQLDQAVLAAGNLWFWRDGERREIEVTAELPAGVEFSTPWPETSRDSRSRVFRPAATPASWKSRLALGSFPVSDLMIGGARIRLAMLGEFGPDQQSMIEQWIREPALGVARVTGTFPQQQPQVLVVGIGPRSGPVPWAHVIRGGGVAVEFFVDETRSLEELRKDYTATHELSHLLLPYVSSQDRWLSEGLASYYQNVLRARDGRLSEVEAWRKLNAGFERGENDSRHGGNMDTYWRGASILMQADAGLRAESGGRQSLDTALAALHACCHDAGRRWLALELFEKLDELTGSSLFRDLYARHAFDRAFPDPEPTFEKLGVMRDGAGIELNNEAPWSRIRHFIMKPGAIEVVQANACAGLACGASD